MNDTPHRSPVRIVAVTTRRAVIDRSLAHLEQRTATLVPVSSRAPPPSDHAPVASACRIRSATPHGDPS